MLNLVVREKQRVGREVEVWKVCIGKGNKLGHVIGDVAKPFCAPLSASPRGLRRCAHGPVEGRSLLPGPLWHEKEVLWQVERGCDGLKHISPRRRLPTLVLGDRLRRDGHSTHLRK